MQKEWNEFVAIFQQYKQNPAMKDIYVFHRILMLEMAKDIPEIITNIQKMQDSLLLDRLDFTN